MKLDKLVTVERSIVLGELGELSATLLKEVNEKLQYALELDVQQTEPGQPTEGGEESDTSP